TNARYAIYRQHGDPRRQPEDSELLSIHKFGDFGIYAVGFYDRIRNNPTFAHLRDLIEQGALA
ncbi:hypothetical protein V5799_029756, partial [Amblyomma americanum]